MPGSAAFRTLLTWAKPTPSVRHGSVIRELREVGILQAMIPEFSDEIRLTRPPWPVQRAAAFLLGPVGRGRGYRSTYPEAAGSPR